MKRFIDSEIAWPPGVTKLHVYFTPKRDEIGELAAAYREQIKGFNTEVGELVSPVADEWIHLTLQMIDRPALDVTPAQLTELQQRLQEQVAQHRTFAIQTGPVIAGTAGVLIDVLGNDELVALQDSTRTAIIDVFGQNVITGWGGRSHISLGYATGSFDSGLLATRLRRAPITRARLMVDQVHLLDVTQDPQLSQYRWKKIASFPLA